MSRLFYTGLGKTTPWEKLSNAISITYDDVTLITQNSTVNSRKEADTSVTFGPYRLTLPIINAPMDTVGSEALIRELAKAGGIGCLPRHRGDINEVLPICERLSKDDVPCMYAIGFKNAMEDAKALKAKGAKLLLLDVAHGGMEKVREEAVNIKKKLKIHVVLGNIASYKQALAYKKDGLDIARVGVGGGAVCITREVAGVGVPQLAAVFETTAVEGMTIIADGGIKGSKDVVKAIAAGATIVMIGSLFAGTDEAPKIRDEKGNLIYRGQASASYMRDNKTKVTSNRAVEGVEVRIKEKGPVKNVLDAISGGLKSAMSYSGAKTIEEFQKKAIFNLVSASAQLEGMPHMKLRADNIYGE